MSCQGEVGNAFYIVESGQLHAYKDKSPLPIMSYSPGDYFGELALLGSVHTRAATVRARTNATLLVLDADNFHQLLGSLIPQLQEAAKGYSGYRPSKLGKVGGCHLKAPVARHVQGCVRCKHVDLGASRAADQENNLLTLFCQLLCGLGCCIGFR